MDFLLSACEIAEAPSTLLDIGQAANRGSEDIQGKPLSTVKRKRMETFVPELPPKPLVVERAETFSQKEVSEDYSRARDRAKFEAFLRNYKFPNRPFPDKQETQQRPVLTPPVPASRGKHNPRTSPLTCFSAQGGAPFIPPQDPVMSTATPFFLGDQSRAEISFSLNAVGMSSSSAYPSVNSFDTTSSSSRFNLAHRMRSLGVHRGSFDVTSKQGSYGEGRGTHGPPSLGGGRGALSIEALLDKQMGKVPLLHGIGGKDRSSRNDGGGGGCVEGGGAAGDRVRARRAPTCESCARSKVKCDRMPPCSRCVRIGVDCNPRIHSRRLGKGTSATAEAGAATTKAAAGGVRAAAVTMAEVAAGVVETSASWNAPLSPSVSAHHHDHPRSQGAASRAEDMESTHTPLQKHPLSQQQHQPALAC